MKENIVLIGFMGSGKTSVGEYLSNQLSYSLVDTDQIIETESQMSISQIFSDRGEAYFRDLETKTVERLANSLQKHVISTGGGLPMRECNAEILKKLGFVVYLKIKKESVLRRLQGDQTRPLLAGEHVEEKVEKLLNDRDPIYEVSAHIVVAVDELKDGVFVDRSFKEIAEEIIRNYAYMKKSNKD